MRNLLIGLLLLTTLLTSIVWHLPTSWLLSQTWVDNNLPPQLSLSSPQGYWWQGSANTTLRLNGQTLPIGQVKWQWQPSALLFGKLGLSVSIQQNGYQLSANLHAGTSSLSVSSLNGRIDLAKTQAQLPPQWMPLGAVKGTVQLENLAVSLLIPKTQVIAQAWPTQLQGIIQVSNLNMLGAQIAKLTLKPTVQQKQIRLKVNGKDAHWQLQGQLSLLPSLDYQTHLTLTAASRNQLPSWQSLFMRQTSPTQARVNQRGNLRQFN